MAARVPCEVCGKPTASKYRVCAGSAECKHEFGIRYRAAEHPEREERPCAVCGRPCRGRYGVCTGTPECTAEFHRRRDLAVGADRLREDRRQYYEDHKEESRARSRQWRAEHPDMVREKNKRWRAANPEKRAAQQRRWNARKLPACEICGGPTFSPSGICTKTPGCLEARRLRAQAAKPPKPQKPSPPPCGVCGAPTRSSLGVCQRTRGCRDEYSRRRLALLPACLGCGKPTGAESGRCPPCLSRYRRNQGGPWKAQRPPWWNRRSARHKKVRQLAAIQYGLCAWCRDPLGDDPGVIEIDHKIPQVILWRALGYVIHDDWNLQVLHPPCNLDKSDGATVEAVALADEHGLDLGAWGRWLRTDRQQELFAAS